MSTDKQKEETTTDGPNFLRWLGREKPELNEQHQPKESNKDFQQTVAALRRDEKEPVVTKDNRLKQQVQPTQGNDEIRLDDEWIKLDDWVFGQGLVTTTTEYVIRSVIQEVKGTEEQMYVEDKDDPYRPDDKLLADSKKVLAVLEDDQVPLEKKMEVVKNGNYVESWNPFYKDGHYVISEEPIRKMQERAREGQWDFANGTWSAKVINVDSFKAKLAKDEKNYEQGIDQFQTGVDLLNLHRIANSLKEINDPKALLVIKNGENGPIATLHELSRGEIEGKLIQALNKNLWHDNKRFKDYLSLIKLRRIESKWGGLEMVMKDVINQDMPENLVGKVDESQWWKERGQILDEMPVPSDLKNVEDGIRYDDTWEIREGDVNEVMTTAEVLGYAADWNNQWIDRERDNPNSSDDRDRWFDNVTLLTNEFEPLEDRMKVARETINATGDVLSEEPVRKMQERAREGKWDLVTDGLFAKVISLDSFKANLAKDVKNYEQGIDQFQTGVDPSYLSQTTDDFNEIKDHQALMMVGDNGMGTITTVHELSREEIANLIAIPEIGGNERFAKFLNKLKTKRPESKWGSLEMTMNEDIRWDKAENFVGKEKLSEYEVNRRLSQVAKERLEKLTQNPEGIEKLVNRTSRLVQYGSANRILLMGHHGNSFATKEKYLKADPAFAKIDWNKIDHAATFVPKQQKPGKKMKPIAFTKGQMYSAKDIQEQYPELGKKAMQVANQNYQRGLFAAPEKVRGAYVQQTYSRNYVKKPEWVEDRPLASAQLRIARYMTEANAGLVKKPFEFSETEKKALARLQPGDLKTLYGKASGLAKKLNYLVGKQFAHDQKLYREQNRQQGPVRQQTKARER